MPKTKSRCVDNVDKANEEGTSPVSSAVSAKSLRGRTSTREDSLAVAFGLDMFLNCFLIAAVAVLEVSCSELFRFAPKKIGMNPGPSVIATRGEVWPRPQLRNTTDDFFIVRSNFFQFKVTGESCDMLERALQRYKQELKVHERTRRTAAMFHQNDTLREKLGNDSNFVGYLDELSVYLGSPCEDSPPVDMNELYELRVNTEDFPKEASLISQSIWGILRGLETWSQLIYMTPDLNALAVNGTFIMDFPRFPHRGLLIDTSRHFLPLRTIYSMLDGMVMSKLNVLHWHVVDDQSFPFQSRTFSNLSAFGAYAPSHIYSPEAVQSVIAYAADRGIRVIPEFDTPGHTRSWGQGYPELLTECYFGDKPDGSLGPMNPIAPGTYSFMKEFLKEIKETFLDSFVHLGGDEVEYACWESNPEIREFVQSRNWTLKKLEEMYIRKIIGMASNLSMTSVVWQEVFDNGAVLPENTVVQIWKMDHQKELYDVTRKGYKVLLSSCWYLDALQSGGDWNKFYRCDPHDFPGNDRQKKLVVGGEACMWGEVVDVSNVLTRVWPRACAAAEKLWSPAHSSNISEASRRLEEHTCRMNRRKIPAQPPTGPGFCLGLNFA